MQRLRRLRIELDFGLAVLSLLPLLIRRLGSIAALLADAAANLLRRTLRTSINLLSKYFTQPASDMIGWTVIFGRSLARATRLEAQPKETRLQFSPRLRTTATALLVGRPESAILLGSTAL